MGTALPVNQCLCLRKIAAAAARTAEAPTSTSIQGGWAGLSLYLASASLLCPALGMTCRQPFHGQWTAISSLFPSAHELSAKQCGTSSAMTRADLVGTTA